MRKKGIGIGIVILLLLSFFFWKAFGKKEEERKEYKTAKIEKREVLDVIELKGRVEVKDTLSVFVDKSLKVKEIFVKEGDYVERGSRLMTFDDDSKNTVLRNIEKTNLQLQKLRRNYQVESELEKIGGAAANTLKDLAEEIRMQELLLEEYREDFAKTATEILSPVSGTITELIAQKDYRVNTDTPLLKIADLSDIKIVLEIPEYDVPRISEGKAVRIKPEIYEEKKSFPGKIERIGKIAKISSSTSENILELEVRPEEEIPFLAPGFKVSAELPLHEGEGKQILVPKSALLEEEGKFLIFVLEREGKTKKRELEIEVLRGQDVKVTKGLQEGEEIVLNPDANLKEGEEIFDRNQQAK